MCNRQTDRPKTDRHNSDEQTNLQADTHRQTDRSSDGHKKGALGLQEFKLI